MMRTATSKFNEWLVRLVGVPFGFILASIVVWGYWWSQDTPPVTVMKVSPTSAVRGSAAVISIRVRRDLSRQCSAHIDRQLIDGSGASIALRAVTLDQFHLKRREARTPGFAVFTVRIPSWAEPGPGEYNSVVNYTCNPIQYFRPIQVRVSVPILIK